MAALRDVEDYFNEFKCEVSVNDCFWLPNTRGWNITASNEVGIFKSVLINAFATQLQLHKMAAVKKLKCGNK